MNNPRLLKKGHEGLDTVVGRDRLWKAKTSRNWNTCKPHSKETLRLYPVATLLAPREAMDDCKLVKPVSLLAHGCGQCVEGTNGPRNVVKSQRISTGAIHARHVDVDVLGHHFELLPFGSGWRSCVGTSLALKPSNWHSPDSFMNFICPHNSESPLMRASV